MNTIYLNQDKDILISVANSNNVSDGSNTFGELYEHLAELYITLLKSINDFYILENPLGYNEKYYIWCSRKSKGNIPLYEGYFSLGIIKDRKNLNDLEVNLLEEISIIYNLPLTYWNRVIQFADELDIGYCEDIDSSEDLLEKLKKLI